MTPTKLGKAQLVEAYELRDSGVETNVVAKYFGVTPQYLRCRIRRAERFGLGFFKSKEQLAMDNVVNIRDYESCDYTLGVGDIGVRSKYNDAQLVKFDGAWVISSPDSVPIEFKSRKELAEWLWASVRLVDSEGRYEKANYVGLDYE